MGEIWIEAISSNEKYGVVRRGKEYTIIDMKEGVTDNTSWGTKRRLLSARVKGGFKKLKEPTLYEKGGGGK